MVMPVPKLVHLAANVGDAIHTLPLAAISLRTRCFADLATSDRAVALTGGIAHPCASAVSITP